MGKTLAQIEDAIRILHARGEPVLFTRLEGERAARLPRSLRSLLDYDADSNTAFLNGRWQHRHWDGSVAVLSGGSADLRVVTEVTRTLAFLGVRAESFEDIGVAGLWRLQKALPAIKQHELLVVVAGMEAALATIVAGLCPQPIIAVPTSVGYGVSAGGIAALGSLAASCAPGITLVNIDNGFGAALAACRVLGLLARADLGPTAGSEAHPLIDGREAE